MNDSYLTRHALDRDRCFQKFHQTSGEPTLAVAVSGGADSMALLHLLVDWKNSLADTPSDNSPDLHVLTIDHGLRPEAAREVLWVTEKAQQLGVKTTILKWEGEKPATRIQENARNARYQLITDWCLSNKVATVLTAHHQNDQAETVLMRLARGSGVDGLAGMSELTLRNGVKVFRPLLDVPKADLLRYMEEHNLEWLEDPGNRNDDFERVRVRQALAQLHSTGLTTESITRSSRRLERVSKALDKITQEACLNLLTIASEGHGEIEFEPFLDLPEEIALRVLSTALFCIGGKEVLPSMGKLEEVLKVLTAREPKAQSLSGCLIISEVQSLLLVRECRKNDVALAEISPGQTLIWDNRFKVQASLQMEFPSSIRLLSEEAYLQIPEEGKKFLHEDSRLKNPYIRAGLLSLWVNGKLAAVPHMNIFLEGFRPEHIDVEFLDRRDSFISSG